MRESQWKDHAITIFFRKKNSDEQREIMRPVLELRNDSVAVID